MFPVRTRDFLQNLKEGVMRSDETCPVSMSSVNIRRRHDLSLQKKGSWLVKNLRVRAVLELRRAGNDESAASQRKKNK